MENRRKRPATIDTSDQTYCDGTIKSRRLEGQVKEQLYRIDTNEQLNGVGYRSIITTDKYRPGRPYKMFTNPGESTAVIIIDFPENCQIHSLSCALNHCRTNCHGIIDIYVNDQPFLLDYQEARWDDFGQQSFSIPISMLKTDRNMFAIMLNEKSRGVYWLSDIAFMLEYTSTNLGLYT